jgi:predicted nucleic acid-binding protein
VVSARLLYPEARAALAAARRARRLSPQALMRTRGELERRVGQLDLIELSEPVARAAGEAAERHGLHAGDAIHLASALALATHLTVLTWDGHLRRASLAAGLSVSP